MIAPLHSGWLAVVFEDIFIKNNKFVSLSDNRAFGISKQGTTSSTSKQAVCSVFLVWSWKNQAILKYNYVSIYWVLHDIYSNYLEGHSVIIDCSSGLCLFPVPSTVIKYFPKILRNSKKNQGSYIVIIMYYNITKFLQFVVAPTRCILNAIDLKNFPNTIMLLKADYFEGFTNCSNVDELVINSTSGRNCSNYKLNNNNYKLNNNLAWKNSALLFWVLSNLGHKYPLHIAISLQNLVYF